MTERMLITDILWRAEVKDCGNYEIGGALDQEGERFFFYAATNSLPGVGEEIERDFSSASESCRTSTRLADVIAFARECFEYFGQQHLLDSLDLLEIELFVETLLVCYELEKESVYFIQDHHGKITIKHVWYDNSGEREHVDKYQLSEAAEAFNSSGRKELAQLVQYFREEVGKC
jgi:hypothetical protein